MFFSRLNRGVKFNSVRTQRRFASEAEAVSANQVKFSLATPTTVFFSGVPVDSVILPGLEGEFQINSNLAALITELRPGVVTVNVGATVQRYFISGGFVFVHEGSEASCNPVECIELENLDPEMAKQVLNDARTSFASASTELDKAVAQIRMETASDILAAISK